jgi:hypothetical protein
MTLDVSAAEFEEVAAVERGGMVTVTMGPHKLILTADQAGALSEELEPYFTALVEDDDDEDEGGEEE